MAGSPAQVAGLQDTVPSQGPSNWLCHLAVTSRTVSWSLQHHCVVWELSALTHGWIKSTQHSRRYLLSPNAMRGLFHVPSHPTVASSPPEALHSCVRSCSAPPSLVLGVEFRCGGVRQHEVLFGFTAVRGALSQRPAAGQRGAEVGGKSSAGRGQETSPSLRLAASGRKQIERVTGRRRFRLTACQRGGRVGPPSENRTKEELKRNPR